MKKWKKWTALLCAGAMLVSLTACGTQPAGSDSMAAYAGQSVTGQITVLDGTSVTLQIGELSQSDDMQPSDATPPEKPESDASGDTAAEDAGTQPSDATLPEKPEGDATGETTEQTTGAQPSDMTLPDKPEGDDSAAMDGSALPDGQTPPDALPGGQTFTAGIQTLTGISPSTGFPRCRCGCAAARLEAQIGALQGGMMPGGPAGGPGADGERLDTQPPAGKAARLPHLRMVHRASQVLKLPSKSAALCRPWPAAQCFFRFPAMDSCICQMDMLHCILHYFRGEKKWTNNRKREVHFPASLVLYWRQRAHRSGWAIYGDSRISRQSMAAGSFCSFILSWR